jgi:hypothetical protein
MALQGCVLRYQAGPEPVAQRKVQREAQRECSVRWRSTRFDPRRGAFFTCAAGAARTAIEVGADSVSWFSQYLAPFTKKAGELYQMRPIRVNLRSVARCGHKYFPRSRRAATKPRAALVRPTTRFGRFLSGPLELRGLWPARSGRSRTQGRPAAPSGTRVHSPQAGADFGGWHIRGGSPNLGGDNYTSPRTTDQNFRTRLGCATVHPLCPRWVIFKLFSQYVEIVWAGYAPLCKELVAWSAANNTTGHSKDAMYMY